ncbi:transposase [Halocatena pleomorpha]|uniref:transposase n=1 Tax=Halocatena pleomorpha TaxID=1785090 RepID=UPI001F3887AE|nr:transposase [Halocatena pleomorpha]
MVRFSFRLFRILGNLVQKGIQQWAYPMFVELVAYKVESTELSVNTVNSAYTSQRCSHCGFTHENNRDEKVFECVVGTRRTRTTLRSPDNIRRATGTH